jgi:thiamine-monophosphate kinase
MHDTTLGDLGERRILKEIIPKYTQGSGDDCAIIGRGDGTYVVTTDPVPPPAAESIGGDPDPYWLGWLLVTINASDIAAAGAEPLGFVAALDLPRDMKISQLERLLAGTRDSCQANGLRYIGGNLRESASIKAVGTAIGRCKIQPLQRQGASNGDWVVVIGNGGQFWCDVEKIQGGQLVDKMSSPLFSPLSQAKQMYQLHHAELIRCAMDTSDGLAPTLTELASVNQLRIRVDIRSMHIASELHVSCQHATRLWMGWGDWTVLAAVQPSKFKHLKSLVATIGSSCTRIGQFEQGEGVILENDDKSIPMGRLESERFAADSWFSQGVGEYQRQLLMLPMP